MLAGWYGCAPTYETGADLLVGMLAGVSLELPPSMRAKINAITPNPIQLNHTGDGSLGC